MKVLSDCQEHVGSGVICSRWVDKVETLCFFNSASIPVCLYLHGIPAWGGGGLANNFVLLQLYSGYNQYFHQKYLLGTAFQNV